MLELEDVRAGYGRTPVLLGVNLTVREGDMVAVLGRNGVGKSTLLRAVMGAIPLTGGRIRLHGQDLGRIPAHVRARRGIAYVPQGRDIFPGLSVLDNLRVAAYGSGQRSWKERLAEILVEFPVLAQKKDLPGGGLSGGQQQILALGRALMTNPRILLLDEPSEGIQPSIVDQIADAVRTINEQRRITVVLVEQNLDFATRIARHALLMDKGSIVRDLPVRDVLSDKDLQHEYMGV